MPPKRSTKKKKDNDDWDLDMFIEDEDFSADLQTCVKGGPAKMKREEYKEAKRQAKLEAVQDPEYKKLKTDAQKKRFIANAVRRVVKAIDPDNLELPECEVRPLVNDADKHLWKSCDKLNGGQGGCVPDCSDPNPNVPWKKRPGLKKGRKYTFYINEDKDKDGNPMYLNPNAQLRCVPVDEKERIESKKEDLFAKKTRGSSRYDFVDTVCTDGDAQCVALFKLEMRKEKTNRLFGKNETEKKKEYIKKWEDAVKKRDELRDKVKNDPKYKGLTTEAQKERYTNEFVKKNSTEEEIKYYKKEEEVETLAERVKPQCFLDEDGDNVCVTNRDLDNGKLKPRSELYRENIEKEKMKKKRKMKEISKKDIRKEQKILKKKAANEKNLTEFEMMALQDQRLKDAEKKRKSRLAKQRKGQLLAFLNTSQKNLRCKNNYEDWGTNSSQGDKDFLSSVKKVAKKNWLVLGQEGDADLAKNFKSSEFFKTIREKQTNLNCSKRGAFHYQQMIKFLVSPTTPVERLLVSHQLGTGKTLGMIGILEQFYDCGQPMLLFFHRPALVTNFYEELLEKDNKFKDYVVKTLKNPPEQLQNRAPFKRSGKRGDFKPRGFPKPPDKIPDISEKAKKEEKDEYNKKMKKYRNEMVKYRKEMADYLMAARDLLAMKNNINNGCVQCHVKGAPSAPLRAFSYVEGGSKAFRNDPMFRFNQRTSGKDGSLFDSCVVMVDEAHVLMNNALDESFDTEAQKKNVQNFRKRLMSMKYDPRLLQCWAHPDKTKRGLKKVTMGSKTYECSEVEKIKDEKTIFSGNPRARALLKRAQNEQMSDREKRETLEEIKKLGACVNMDCRPGQSLFMRGRAVFFTATPVVKTAEDRTKMLEIVKGKAFKDAPDRNFISYFMSRPEGTFAKNFYQEEFPDLGIRKVVIRDDALRTYVCNRFQVKKPEKSKKDKKHKKDEDVCKNVVRPTKKAASKSKVNFSALNDDIIFSPSSMFDPWYKGLVTNKKLKINGDVVMENPPHPNIQRYENMNSNRYTMRQLKSSNKNKDEAAAKKSKVQKLEDEMVTEKDHPGFKKHAPKLHSIARAVKSHVKKNQKVAVMIHKTNGLDILAHHLKIACKDEIEDVLYLGQEFDNKKKEFVAVKDGAKIQGMLNSFNSESNNRGGNVPVVLLDPKYHTEGISLKDVRLFILGDISTGTSKDDANWGLFKQRIGRVFRTCGHKTLPKNEREVKVLLFLSTFPVGYKEFKKETGSGFRPVKESLKTYEEHKLEAMRKQYQEVEEKGMKNLKNNSIEEFIRKDFYIR